MTRELVEYLARQLVDDPAAVSVEELSGEEGSILRLHVAPDDLGKVIGRGGRIARALRTLARASAGRVQQRVTLEIVE